MSHIFDILMFSKPFSKGQEADAERPGPNKDDATDLAALEVGRAAQVLGRGLRRDPRHLPGQSCAADPAPASSAEPPALAATSFLAVVSVCRAHTQTRIGTHTNVLD